jgi:hypothetical protein
VEGRAGFRPGLFFKGSPAFLRRARGSWSGMLLRALSLTVNNWKLKAESEAVKANA